MVDYSFISFRRNPSEEKRPWQQFKMKYENIVQTDKTCGARGTAGRSLIRWLAVRIPAFLIFFI